MARKKRYTLAVYGYETLMVPTMDISQKVFRSIKAQLEAKAKEKNAEYPVQTYTDTRRGVDGHSDITEYRYTVATTDVCLVEEVCDEGYCFVGISKRDKKKGE